jgi:2-polyprenyl-3-methyl-5-hydroxy-6-metoxy-1,4-benzoquinol methylase
VQLHAVQRRLEPEILDSLPPEHPDALKSRRDLRVINRVMGNARWFRSALSGRVRPGERVLELGSGTGELARHLRPVAPLIDSIDRVPPPPTWPASARWHQADIQDFAGWNDYPVVIGNLILHHFTDEALTTLGAAIRPHARLLVFSEPTRKRFNQHFWDFITPLVGAHPVTQHDGSVSIAAGFRGNELPLALGLDPKLWQWRVTSSWLGACRVIATRRP